MHPSNLRWHMEQVASTLNDPARRGSVSVMDLIDPIVHDPTRPLYNLGGLTDPVLASQDWAVAKAFLARADAYMGRGEYHLAIADYGRALNATPRGEGFLCERNREAYIRRREAAGYLTWFFHCGGDPANLPADATDALRVSVRSARLPAGHLVVAEGGGVLAVYPPTDEGRRAAVTHADALAADPDARSVIDNLYLAETDDFDAVVYACQAGKAVEVHRAAPRPADANPGPAGD